MTCDERPEDLALLDELVRLSNDPTLTDAEHAFIVAVLDRDGRIAGIEAALRREGKL